VALVTLVGFVVQRRLGIDGALVVGLLVGMAAANFVPLAPCRSQDPEA
jgi:hypothetical protein